jgi:SAM-dependent methyltransferase
VGISATTYYHPTSPIARLLDGVPDRSVMNQVAVVGLGAGSMACLSQTGENWTFFEIDPAVVELASNPDLFSFLRDCDGNFDVQVGDGRLSLDREADEKFGLIVLDAFSSDAIPIHLMTREAVELYARKLSPGGMIAFHISNRYLDLEPVIGNVARAAGLACHGRTDTRMQRGALYKFPSQWVALSRSRADLGRVARSKGWRPCAIERGARAWSDDYANVVGAFR